MTGFAKLGRVALAILCTSAAACRAASPAPGLSTIKGSEGLVIDADGTVYFSQPAAIGRLTPGGKLDEAWVKLSGRDGRVGPRDRSRASGPAGRQPDDAHDLRGHPRRRADGEEPRQRRGPAERPHDGLDGALYFTDFAPAGDVYRVTANGTRAKVTTTPLPKPNGLAFGPDGALYVDLFAQGAVAKLTLAAGIETARAPFIVPGAVPHADGLAFDAAGNAYIGFGDGVSRASADGKTLTRLSKGGTANVEFGAGAIDGKDLYAVTGGKIVRIANDVPGAAVPWHVAGP